MKEKCGIDEVTVNDLFNVCESEGLLSKTEYGLIFHTNFFFEESILNSNPDDDEKEKIAKIPINPPQNKTRRKDIH